MANPIRQFKDASSFYDNQLVIRGDSALSLQTNIENFIASADNYVKQAFFMQSSDYGTGLLYCETLTSFTYIKNGNIYQITTGPYSMAEVYALSSTVQQALAQKADFDGYYAMMGVGIADNFSSTVQLIDTTPYIIRSSGGSADLVDGNANLKKVKGNTVVFNQLVKSTVTGTTSANGLTFTRATDGSVTINGTATANTNYSIVPSVNSTAVIIGRKYYVKDYKPHDTTSVSFGGQALSSNKQILTYNGANLITYGYMTITSGAVFNNEKYYPQVFDLTLMFGTGNEPTTVAEFEAIFNLDYYAYTLGTILNVNITGLKTVGYNAWNGSVARVIKGELGTGKNNGYEVLGTYTTIDFAQTVDGPKTQLTVYNDLGYDYILPPTSGYVWINGADDTTWLHLVWSKGADTDSKPEYWESTRAIDSSIYFPNGMNGVGSVYDELLPNKYIKKFVKVDLGTLTWTYHASTGGTDTNRFDANTNQLLPNAIKYVGENTMPNIICSKYKRVTSNQAIYTTYGDKNISQYRNQSIAVVDSAYTDPVVFKTAMSGVYLIYELATPIETPINPILNLTYRVSDMGIEEWIETIIPTIAVNQETGYIPNANDKLRRLPDPSAIGQPADLNTTSKVIVGAINEVNSIIANHLALKVNVPINANATGTVGQWAINSTHLYYCVATDTWVRVELTTWGV